MDTSAGRTIDVAGTRATERQAPPPGGSGSSVTLGSGLGAFEPFLRESYEDMKALKAKRDAAIEELERSKITPGERNWGDRVRQFFTGERDLWGARANQGIAKVRKLTYASRNRTRRSETRKRVVQRRQQIRGVKVLLRNCKDV